MRASVERFACARAWRRCDARSESLGSGGAGKSRCVLGVGTFQQHATVATRLSGDRRTTSDADGGGRVRTRIRDTGSRALTRGAMRCGSGVRGWGRSRPAH